MTISSQEKAIASVFKAIETIKDGGMVIMVDDEDRENEGDIVFAAEHVCAEKVNFMAREARGLICLTLDQENINKLKLPMMEDASKSKDQKCTAFTVSIEAAEGVTTGISAADRAQTIRVAIKDDVTPDDILVPGHVFPLKAKPGGVLERAGHTEASVDIARLAGLKSAGVICEIMNDDGTMARMPELEVFAEKHNLPIVSIADMITFRLLKESLIEPIEHKPIKTPYGTFDATLFKSLVDGSVHMAIIKGENLSEKVVDVRVHKQRPLVDVFSHDSEGGRRRIDYGLKMLTESDAAVFVYLTNGMGADTLRRDMGEMHDSSKDEVSAELKPLPNLDPWAIGIGAQILRYHKIKQIRVHTSNQRPLKGLTGFDLEVVETKVITRVSSNEG